MESGWRRVAELIKEDVPRVLRMSWAEFYRHADLGDRTVQDLRKGERTSYDDLTIAKLESALGWKYGSVDDIVKGRRHPTRIPDPHLARVLHAWPELDEETRELLADLAERNRPSRR